MFSNIYLSPKCRQTNGWRNLIFPQPYKEGITNIKKGWKGQAARIYRGLPDIGGAKESLRSLKLLERVKHIIVGAVLLIPIINTFALFILRKVGVQNVPLAVPAPTKWVCWDRLPAPYPASNLAALDTLEYRHELDPTEVKRRIEKQNFDARKQQQEWDQFPDKFFAEEIERVGKEAPLPKNCLEGELVGKQNGSETKVLFSNLLSAGVAVAQGMRPEMEDAHLREMSSIKIKDKEYSFKVSAIFDGHNGKGMADFAKANLINVLKKRLVEFNATGVTDTGIWNACKVALVDLSRSYNGNCGSTANITLQIGADVWLINLGDSRAILIGTPDITSSSIMQLTEDQKFDDKYRRGIYKRGHTVLEEFYEPPRLDGRLALARALGDHDFAGGVSARPKITRLTLPPDYKGQLYILQGCDGIWDVGRTGQVGKLVQQLLKEGYPLPMVAAQVVKAAYQAGSQDNLSALIQEL